MWIVINVNCKFNNFQYKDEFFLCNSCVMVFDLIVQLDKIFESWFIWVVCKSLQILIGFCLWEWWIGNYKKWLWMNYCSLFCDCSRVAALPLSQSLSRCDCIPRFAWLLLSDCLYHFASKIIEQPFVSCGNRNPRGHKLCLLIKREYPKGEGDLRCAWHMALRLARWE